ncbi:MAG: ribokinase [Microbacteriaceae bacterium]|nr:ribokinase [Microbacteriaceae bacterium]
MPTVVVVGSANVDQVFRVERIPTPGETVLSHGLTTALGGKGQNQAVAAARAGVSTVLIAALGDDAFGASIRAGLAGDGIDVALLRNGAGPTGTALIAVDDGGENTIIVEAGANAGLLGLTEADAAAIRSADVLTMQLEIPLETVAAAAGIARAAGTTVVLNAAPIRSLPDEVLASVDILLVNEHEAAVLATGRSGGIQALVPIVIVTLGAEGAVLYEAGKPEVRIPAPRVTAVDATGAGDTFCGALAAAMAEGQALEAALRFAVVAASLSVQRHGAVPSIPTRHEIDGSLSRPIT